MDNVVAWHCVNSVTGKMAYTDSESEMINMRDCKTKHWQVTPLCVAVASRVVADERASFEAKYGPKDAFAWRNADGTYKVASLQMAWEIWQARATLASFKPFGFTDEQTSQAVDDAKVKCVHPDAATTIDIGRAVLNAAAVGVRSGAPKCFNCGDTTVDGCNERGCGGLEDGNGEPELTDAEIDAVWADMNGSTEWLCTFGYQQFARAILAARGAK